MKKSLRILSVLLFALLVLAAFPLQQVRATEAATEPQDIPVASPSEEVSQVEDAVPETAGIVQGSSSDETDGSGISADDEGISATEESTPEDIPTDPTPSEKEKAKFTLTREMLIAAAAIFLLVAILLAVLLGRAKAEVRQLRGRITELESRPATAPTAPVASGPEDVTRTSRPAAVPAANTVPGFFLEGTGGYYAGQRIPVRVQMGFGRDAGCDIRYPSEAGGISKVHCALIPAKDGVILVDLGSTCGTFLGTGERLKPHHNYLLRHGDKFFLCNPDQAFRIQ